MFAGPNGSGKSTVKESLNKSAEWFGAYVNPDEIERIVRDSHVLPLAPYGLSFPSEELRRYFSASEFLASAGVPSEFPRLDVGAGGIGFGDATLNSYHASVLADFLRRKLLAARNSFTFETVMSSPDKVELLRESRLAGYRTYLYFIATDDPAVNIDRVRSRVAAGGHDVPEDKIVARHARSLSLLPAAIDHSDRAYFFDTSRSVPLYFAEVTAGMTLTLHSHDLPLWFEPILALFPPKS